MLVMFSTQIYRPMVHEMRRLLLIIGIAVNVGVASGQTVHLVLVNTSNARTELTLEDNYLVLHSGFILSYNRQRGTANWVTWHLQSSDLGPIDRTTAFRTDTK